MNPLKKKILKRRAAKASPLLAIAGVAAGYLVYQWAQRYREMVGTPKEIAPLPTERAYDRQKNIDYLAENYDYGRYQPPRRSETQPNPKQDFVEKDKDPLHGFHGG